MKRNSIRKAFPAAKKPAFFALAMALALALPLAAQTGGKPVLAILPFTGGEGEDGETIAELFSYQPALAAAFAPVPRTSINRAVQAERNFQLVSGMTGSDTIIALGRQVGARFVVSGSITRLGNRKLLVIAIVRTDTLEQVSGDIQTYTGIGEIEGKLPEMARNIASGR